jgi:hypothetical protein
VDDFHIGDGDARLPVDGARGGAWRVGGAWGWAAPDGWAA